MRCDFWGFGDGFVRCLGGGRGCKVGALFNRGGRLEIKDPIHGPMEVDASEVHILDSAVCQRLRQIKQLGFAEYSFPGAVHNRYIHSLGVMHLTGVAFDNIFKKFQFSSPDVRQRLRHAVRLGALLHDIGHGPLSHTTEEVMPQLRELNVKAYEHKKVSETLDRKANHEDYTIKFLTDSSLTLLLRASFPDVDPLHVACLIDKSLNCPDDFFVDRGLNLRPILSQLVSSELDCDRMDYLERDAYFCGTNYGKVELNWLLGNLTWHEVAGKVHLALDRRAIYTFDDFLISRHHMYLMVYFHHKSIVYEEMLMRYLSSPDCTYRLPADIEEYTRCTDYSLYEHLAQVTNPWAKRIAERRPYRMLFELHSVAASERPTKMNQCLEEAGIHVIWASSHTRLSKYHTMSPDETARAIYVVDHSDPMQKPVPIERVTGIFQKYEETRHIDRLYVAPDRYEDARRLITERKL
ncbi:MAG: HD domain-containing protein [Bdellovibrionaceae bacterium]|nr:HD domain-containing protein [Pseudobdellovibrionaceae bacterium]